MAIRAERGRALDRAVEELADRHAARSLVDDGPEPADEIREVGLIPIEPVILTSPRGGAIAIGVRAQVRVLQEGVEHVEPEPVDAARQPASHDVELRLLDAGGAPVELGLLDEERVEVELLAVRVPLPPRPAEEREPVVGRKRAAVAVVARGIAPQVPVGVRPAARLARGAEPGVLVARVVQHEVEDHPQATPVRLVDQPVEIGLAAEHRIDRGVVADVVADVQARGKVDRGEPDRIDAETGRAEIVEVVDDAAEVTDAVAVAVGEAPRVDLVHHAALPPVRAEARRSHGRGGMRAWH
jgi:hypothetical protein